MSSLKRNQNKVIIDNDGWSKMTKTGKPPKTSTISAIVNVNTNKLILDEYDDEETKEIKKAIELSIKTKKTYKSPEEREIEIAIQLSMEHDIMINSTTEFPVISGSLIVQTSNNKGWNRKSNKVYIR